MAMKMGAPIVALVDCAGFRLQESMDALDGFGKLYVCQAMASGVIPQIQAVFGNCGGGMAVASEMADFTFMEQEAKMFVNAPFVIAENDADNSSAGKRDRKRMRDWLRERNFHRDQKPCFHPSG